VVEPLPVAEYMLCEIHWQRSSSARDNSQAALAARPRVGNALADEDLYYIFDARDGWRVQIMLPTSPFGG
jgi:hypothetical protein